MTHPTAPLVLPPFAPLLYNGEPAITLAMMADFHRCPNNTIRQAFRRNRQHLIPGEDFVEVPAVEFARLMGEWNAKSKGDRLSPLAHTRGRDRVLLFETGYLLLSKPLTDDEAWKVMRSLVREYFRANAPARRPQALPPTTSEALFEAFARTFLPLKQTLDAMGADMETLRSELAETQRRRRIGPAVRDCHRQVIHRREGGLCPCCRRERIVSPEDGAWTAAAQMHSYRGPQFNGLQQTWPVCKACWHLLRKRGFWLDSAPRWQAYQQSVRLHLRETRPQDLFD